MQDINEMTFEQAYTELTELVIALESGEMPLEKSVELYERGKLLTTHCEQLLENAELRVNTLKEGDLG